MRIRITAALAALGLLAAACSSSGSPDAQSSSAGTTDSTSSAPAGSSSAPSSSTPSSSAGDAANGSSLTLLGVQASDLPSTWKAGPADNSDTSAEDKQVADCVGIPYTKPAAGNVVNSPDYTLENADVSSTVTRVASDAIVEQDEKQFDSPKLKGCLEAEFTALASKQAGGKVAIKSLTITRGPASGDPANVVATSEVQIDVTQNGTPVTVYITDVAVRGPRIEGDITFTGALTPFDATLRKSVVAAVAARVAKG